MPADPDDDEPPPLPPEIVAEYVGVEKARYAEIMRTLAAAAETQSRLASVLERAESASQMRRLIAQSAEELRGSAAGLRRLAAGEGS